MSGKFYLEKWIDTDLKPYFDKNRRWSVCDLRAIYVRAFCKGQEQAAKRDEDIARALLSKLVQVSKGRNWEPDEHWWSLEEIEKQFLNYINSEDF